MIDPADFLQWPLNSKCLIIPTKPGIIFGEKNLRAFVTHNGVFQNQISVGKPLRNINLQAVLPAKLKAGPALKCL